MRFDAKPSDAEVRLLHELKLKHPDWDFETHLHFAGYFWMIIAKGPVRSELGRHMDLWVAAEIAAGNRPQV